MFSRERVEYVKYADIIEVMSGKDFHARRINTVVKIIQACLESSV